VLGIQCEKGKILSNIPPLNEDTRKHKSNYEVFKVAVVYHKISNNHKDSSYKQVQWLNNVLFPVDSISVFISILAPNDPGLDYQLASIDYSHYCVYLAKDFDVEYERNCCYPREHYD
jgi:hypothetical protein